MQFCFGKNEWKDIVRGQEKSFLLTNGLGGYANLTMVGSNDRNDSALLMAAIGSPQNRYHLISNVKERLCMKSGDVGLWSQQFHDGESVRCHRGYLFLNQFSYECLPIWNYQAKGIEVEKTLVMPQGENCIGIRYRVYKECDEPVTMEVTPLFQFVPKGTLLSKEQAFSFDGEVVESEGIRLYVQTDGVVQSTPLAYEEGQYYEKDDRDGRDYIGRCASMFKVTFELTQKEQEFTLIFSTEKGNRTMQRLIPEAKKHVENILFKAALIDEVGNSLVQAVHAYIAKTKDAGKTILAGFPFFTDWGRDTMIALPGCIYAGCHQEAAQILRNFMMHEKNGLLPNMFPEGEGAAFYNTVDASLLFFNAVYEYLQVTKDACFAKEAVSCMDSIIENYKKGTDYHICMDEDGLIMAGADLDQLTWMDVRFGEILPTPRHGKPVEINALWYNALCVADCIRGEYLSETAKYEELAKKVKESFLAQFWMEEKGYLKDVISVGDDNIRELVKYRAFEQRECDETLLKEMQLPDVQIRPNQIWAASLPYSMLDYTMAESVLKIVYERLFTPYGLRTLDHADADYHPYYEGPQEKRDMAYHQGTVWPWLMGEYYLAFLRNATDKEKAVGTVRRQLESMKSCLSEGCLGHIAEVYDGIRPAVSKGCFAQAWSDCEMLRVYVLLEEIERELVRGQGMTGKEKKALFESAAFEKNFGYDGDDLGAVIDKANSTTTFKVWAPTASAVSLNLYKSGDVTAKNWISTQAMNQEGRGVWSVSVKENLDGTYYTYSVTVDGQTKETADIYAKACGVNGQRSMVIDLSKTNPPKWDMDHPVADCKQAGCIYELHVKDFSYAESSGVSEANRGKYRAFTETKSAAMQHLLSLGVSYVHLLPFYDYGSVDEASADTEQFNWGYDPVNYLIPEGSYSSDAFHGEIRIREVKEMVAALHEAGIGVVMDVVFNHTYSADSWFERTVPGYYYRMDESGKLTNGSACGNDTASDRKMYRKYMKDAVKYLLTEYHLDGLRFDLMGLHDIQTMNEIRQMVNELPNGDKIILYGEPWSAGYTGFREGAVAAVRANVDQFADGIAMFCDYTRDSIKGSVFWDKEPGYANTINEEQRNALTDCIKHAVCAWQNMKPEDFGENYVRNSEGARDMLDPFYPKSPRQIISYVSAHDNYSLWDKLLITCMDDPDFEKEPDKDVLQINKFIAGIVFTCLGQPFMQAGEEFARTKLGAGDSYNLSPKLNRLDYERKDAMEDLVNYYKGLIAFRKKYPAYGEDMEAAVDRICFLPMKKPLVGFTLDDLVIYYNPLVEKVSVNLPDGNFTLVSDGVGFEERENISGEITLLPKSVTILHK